MRTAKEIIEEYRARGYGMESLRVLADSRDEPLRSEMLALLSNEGEGRAAAADDMVFFLVSEGEEIEEVGGDIIDFDILASDVGALADDPSLMAAAGEESIAELAIGDAEGTAFVHFDAEGHETVLHQPARNDHAAQVADDASNERNEMPPPEEANAPEAGERDLVAESTALPAMVDENAGIDNASAQAGETPDQSSDYLPDPAAVGVEEMERDLLAAAFPVTAVAPAQKGASSERRRQRRDERKRAKAEKKMRVKAKLAAEKLGSHLAEIVLSPAEGTETLSEEPCREVALASPSFDFSAAGEGGDSDGSLAGEITADPGMRGGETRVESIGGGESVAIEPAETPERSGAPVSNETIAAFDGGDPLDGNVDAGDEDAEAGNENNVIRLYDEPDGEECVQWASGSAGNEIERLSGNLVLLENRSEAEASDVAGDSARALSPMARIGLLRALTGGEPPVCEFGDMTESVLDSGCDHIIVQPDAEAASPPQGDEGIIAEMEKDYQSRLNEFAMRLLELQTAAAESETRFNEKTRALGEKEKETADLSAKLQSSAETIRGLTTDLAGLSDELAGRREELSALHGLKDEHARLYREFEDLRGAYNEVVTNVMPSLQNERDELVETVERQGEDEENLRRALKTSGRRMAVGYSLAAAAAVMMVALPLTHWMGVDGSEQRLALGHQKASELNERLDKAEMRNVEAEKIIFDLQQQSNLAKLEVEKLEKANHELSRLSDKHTRDVAQLKADLSGGGSARTVLEAGDNLGMSGPISRDGKLRVNEVRDPGGSIETVLAENRERFAREDATAEMARANVSRGNMQISAVTLRAPEPAAGRVLEIRKPAAGQTAIVKKGEGVAHVVYRMLGTRDQRVIAWVVNENKLGKDKRGNPKIFPGQKLVLPSTGEHSLNQASAAKR